MTLIEILTAISLFCPNIETLDYRSGTTYYGHPSDHYSDPDCVKHVWKCIDKERIKTKKINDNYRQLELEADIVQISNLEKCFR